MGQIHEVFRTGSKACINQIVKRAWETVALLENGVDGEIQYK